MGGDVLAPECKELKPEQKEGRSPAPTSSPPRQRRVPAQISVVCVSGTKETRSQAPRVLLCHPALSVVSPCPGGWLRAPPGTRRSGSRPLRVLTSW